MIFNGSGSNRSYRNLPLRKMEQANLILYVNGDGTLEIGKNRYNGVTGAIDYLQGIEILTQLLVGIAYNNTCEMFQEALKKDIYKALEKHKVLEGEEK